MRLLSVFLFAAIMQISAGAYAQYITLSEKNAKLQIIFKEIRAQSGYDFLYNEALIQNLEPINITIKNATINEALNFALTGLPLTYTINDKVVMITEKNIVVQPLDLYTISGVIKDKNGEVLPGTAIFLSGYQKGTVANNEGKFVINNLKAGNYNLLIQMLGYLPANKNVILSNKSAEVEIKLNENIHQLQEVVIKPDPYRKEYLNIFKESFIGTTPNAGKCKIVNAEVLQFDYDSNKRILTAKADEFIILENKALGYRIKYLLKYFEKDEETNLVLFYGYPYFEEMDGSSAKKRQYMAKRKIAYKGSPEHFFSSLYNNNHKEEGFILNKLIKTVNKNKLADSIIDDKIKTYTEIVKKRSGWRFRDSLKYWANMKSEPDTLEVLNRAEVLIDTLMKQKSSSLKTINFKDALYIVFTKEKETKASGVYSSYKINRPPEYSKYQVSIVHHLRNTIDFYRNGRIYDPGSLLYEGAWAYEKVADMVPMDYISPNEKY